MEFLVLGSHEEETEENICLSPSELRSRAGVLVCVDQGRLLRSWALIPAALRGAQCGQPAAPLSCHVPLPPGCPGDVSALFPDSAAIPSVSQRRPSTAWCSLLQWSCSSKYRHCTSLPATPHNDPAVSNRHTVISSKLLGYTQHQLQGEVVTGISASRGRESVRTLT